jgi:hypothetical protein
MKYLMLALFTFNLFSCVSSSIATFSDNEFGLPPEFKSKIESRQIASDDKEFEQYLTETYTSYFEKETSVKRLLKIKMLAHQLHLNMEDKGHSRKRILEKFNADLKKQIEIIQNLESGQENSLVSWLPDPKSPQYSKKILALQSIKYSAYVMGQLETYLAATKVMENDRFYFQTSHYGLLQRALKALAKELDSVPVVPEGLQQSQFSYASFLSSVARNNLYKVFNQKQKKQQMRVDTFFKEIQLVNDSSEAKKLMNSNEMTFARSFLANKEYSGSSEIDGYRDDMDTKISTYFGLEMIRYLYDQLN